VTNQKLQRVQRLTTPSREAAAAEEIRSEAQVAGEVRHARDTLVELNKVRHLLDARTDRRRRPEGVSKDVFKLYRQLGLKPIIPAKKK
jgi:hypothetical protein